jgi:CRP-like cAMP-binding protein
MGDDHHRAESGRDEQLRELVDEVIRLLQKYLEPQKFHKGSLLWREGDTSGRLVVLRKGRVKIYRILPNARSVTLLLFGPGDVFGFLPFLDGQAYPAYAQALEDVEAEVMPRSSLLGALRTEPDLPITLITLLGRRLRESFDQIQRISTRGTRARVAAAILSLYHDDEVAGVVPEVRLPVSAREFAGVLGLQPETFSRAMTGLVEDGILERAESGRYRVLDADALEKATETD